MPATTHIRLRRGLVAVAAAVAAALTAYAAAHAFTPTPTPTAASLAPRSGTTASATTAPFAAERSAAAVRTMTITYTAHTGAERSATVLAPLAYDGTQLPLVISPHGRGGSGAANAALWGSLPTAGNFVVVNPDGAGDRLERFSWGAQGQVRDLARMPEIVERELPWLRIDRHRIYAFGGSMGGQETLLLVAGHPELLAGAAAFDSLVDFPHQYAQFPRLACKAPCSGWGGSLGRTLQRLARTEVGGTPAGAPGEYAARSPIAHAREIAASGVPLQLWWSTEDRIVVDSSTQSGALLEALRREGPTASVLAFEGTWAHTHEMRASALLPHALAQFGLMPANYLRLPTGAAVESVVAAVSTACV